jgi:hypothetical protein
MKYYVSVTGLELDSLLGYPQFIYHAVPSMMQAKRSPGNVMADGRMVGSVHHTLTVWEDKMAMRRFMMSGAHVKAMKSFDSFATGTTYGYEADEIPTWDEALRLLNEKGRRIGKKMKTLESSKKSKWNQNARMVGMTSILLVSLFFASSWILKQRSY